MESNQDQSITLKEENKPSGVYYEHHAGQSFKSLAFKFVLWLINRKNGRNMLQKLKTGQPNKYDMPEPPKELRTEFKVSSSEVNGKNVYCFAPKENQTNKVILYLHGGAYVNNTTEFHWNFIGKLLRELRSTIIFIDYPLAPRDTFLQAYETAELVYKKILTEWHPKDIILMGDSAGGGFSLGLAQKLKHDGIPQPADIVLLAPWLDVTLTNPEIAEIDKDDPMLGIEPCRMAGKAYAGDTDPSHYMLSPINGIIEGLGRISIFIGTHDILWADIKKFKKRCDEASISINYYVYPKMIHAWMLLGLPESQAVINQVKDLLQE